MKATKFKSLRRIGLCAASLALAIAAYPAIADNPDQAPSRDETPSVEIDAGFFDFSKTLSGIMKPPPKDEASRAQQTPQQQEKAAQTKSEQGSPHVEIVKPSKKPKQKTASTAHAKEPESEPQQAANIPPTPLKKPSIKTADNPKSAAKAVASETPKTTPKPIAKKQNHIAELSDKNIALYKDIFTFQENGDIEKANASIKKLTDTRLYGYVLQQRYLHPTAYQTTFIELKEWLDYYADHPGARRIYDLAERKRPSGNNIRLRDPQTKIQISRRIEPTMVVAKRYASSRNRSADEIAEVRAVQKTIIAKTRKGEMASALKTLNATMVFDNIEHDIMAARIAAAYLYAGKTKQAYSLATKSAARSGLHVPLASWVAGLVSWKRGKYTDAAAHFEGVGRSNYASGWTRSAGAYWAARSHMRRGDIKSVSTWLRRASTNPRTFYGLIATRALGEDFDFNWKMPEFTKENHEILSADPRGARAIALTEIGEIAKAQAELLRVNPKQNEDMYRAMLAFSGHARLPSIAMRLGATPADKERDLYYDAALYPLGPWQPKEGYTITPALVNAIMRQESRFDPNAESPSGAKGLMQLMPATAKSVADTDNPDMENPSINLKLGQRYLAQLLKSPRVDNNLLSLLIAYNAGPGNLSKWKRQWSGIKDPLLFIELMPSGETRSYVEHVLSNYWIYRMRENEDTPTLDAVVAGAPVKFASAENESKGGGIETASLK